MAKQAGYLPITGTHSNLTFYKSSDGYLVKEKSGVSADRVLTDPAFQRTRENMAEFGRPGKAAKLFRNIFRALIKGNQRGLISRPLQVM
ncbi:MAG TPA: hypothetical protein VEB42_17160, partial [Chitinophagaceae bacterium]|nr:hypothetical protein [Chitinophagaceae bacterium]